MKNLLFIMFVVQSIISSQISGPVKFTNLISVQEFSGEVDSEFGLIQMAPDKSIYCLDMSENKIHHFDSNLKLINKAGRKGRGPGEGYYFAYMHFNAKGEVIVLDKMLNRFAIFDKNLNFLRHEDYDYLTFYDPDDAVNLKSGNVLTVSYMWSSVPFPLMITSLDYSEKIKDLKFQLTDYFINEEVDRSKTTGGPFRSPLLLVNESTIFFAPYFYSGKITKLVDNSGMWTDESSIKISKVDGFVQDPVPYRLYDENEKVFNRTQTYKLMSGKKVQILRYNTSVGLLKSPNGTILHQTRIKYDNFRINGIEVYDEEYVKLQMEMEFPKLRTV
jgi:hypothetical protein